MRDLLSQLNALPAASCLVAIFLTAFVHSTLVVVPSDTVAINGSNTQLNCSTNLQNPVHWQHIPHGSMLPTDVYLYSTVVNGYVGRYHVQVDINTGAYNLVINNIQFKDAGTFRCLDNQGEGDQKDAKLTVTENTDLQLEPRFAEVQVGEKFKFTCETYYKNEAITWQRIPMGSMLPTDVYLEDQLVNGYEMRYEVKKEVEAGINKLIIKKAELRDSGIFRCIDRSGHGQQVDSQVTVVAPPVCRSSVNASCELEDMENFNLACSVNFSGKTSPTIEWKHEGLKMKGATSIVSPEKIESYLTIHIEKGSSYSSPYSCLSIASKSACTITIQHNCTVSDESTETPVADPVIPGGQSIAAIVVPIVFIIIGIIIGIIIAFVFKRRRNRKSQESTATVGNVRSSDETQPMRATTLSEGQNQGNDENQNDGQEMKPLRPYVPVQPPSITYSAEADRDSDLH